MLAFDMQLEIIKRLPVKSLMQFRCVCKEWKSLIDSSQFIAGYRSQSEHLVISYKVDYGEESEVKYVCFVDDDDDTFPQQNFALTVPPLVQGTTIVIGSSHGLLCLTGYIGDKTQMAVLWNPAIRKSIAVALPNVVRRPFNSVLGFGVCPDTKDPKLVKITFSADYRKMESIPCQVMVFTLSSGEWTCLSSNQLPRNSIVFTCSQTVIGQFIYWFAYDRINVNGGSHNLIMSFDMTTQEFREIELPDSLADMHMSVSKLRESFVLLEYSRNFTTNKQVCDVWMMEDGDSKVFTKLFTVKAPNASVLEALGFRKSGEPIVEMHDDDDDDDDDEDEDFFTPCALVVYEPCSEHVKDLGICGNSFFVYSYTESLLLLDHDDGHIVRCGDVKR